MREMYLHIYMYYMYLHIRLFYSACGSFKKADKISEKFTGTGDVRYTYKGELDKASFKHDLA